MAFAFSQLTITTIQRLVLLTASSMVLSACGDGVSEGGAAGVVETLGTQVPASERRIISEDFARPYVADGPYADVLAKCMLNDATPCTLGEVPFIGQEYDNPTVANIMERVLVTHDWMGLRLEQLLSAMPPETLPLFEPITAIVVGSDIDRSNYWSKYGRIRIDPKYLWLSKSEKRTLSDRRESVYGVGYSSNMNYGAAWRMVRNGDYAWKGYSIYDDEERALSDIQLYATRLIWHELAHASDYIQPYIYPQLLDSDTTLTAVDKVRNSKQTISDRLYADELGITDRFSWMFSISDHLYDKDDPPLLDFTKNFTGADAGSYMADEGRIMLYSYLTRREDVATLFAHAMMKRYYGVSTEFAFVDLPRNIGSASCEDYLIGWGVSNRLADPAVKIRAEYVMKQILGEEIALDNFMANLGTESLLPAGEAWCLTVGNQIRATARDGKRVMPSMQEVLAREQEMFGSHH